jgi:hypothetical protein
MEMTSRFRMIFMSWVTVSGWFAIIVLMFWLKGAGVWGRWGRGVEGVARVRVV